MEVNINTPTKIQISTLPKTDRAQTDASLRRLARDFPKLPNLKRVRPAGNLWELRISPRLRALVQIDNERANVLAVARPDQLRRYWQRELAS